MPRIYKPKAGSKKRAQIDNDKMRKAVHDVVLRGKSIRSTAEAFKLSVMTLKRYVWKKKEAIASGAASPPYEPDYRRSQIFNAKEEDDLAKYWANSSTLHHGLTPKAARELAYQFSVENNKTVPDNWKKNKCASYEWLRGFMHRHDNLPLRTSEIENDCYISKRGALKLKSTANCYIQLVQIEDDCYKSKSGKLHLKKTSNLILNKTYEISEQARSAGGARAETAVTDPDSDDVVQQNVEGVPRLTPRVLGSSDSITGGFEASLTPESPPTPQCRFCAELTENCIDVTDDRPYLFRNKTTLTLNNLCVQLDFNNDTPKTVCRDCDSKLLAMFDFVKQVNEAQESMINVRNDVKLEVDIVKTECESPTPNDQEQILRESNVEDIDDTDKIVDSLTVSETVILKPGVKHKRKQILVPKPHKKPKVIEDVERLECEDSELIDDVKEEIAEMVDEYEVEYLESSDTEIDDHIPSELEHRTILKLMK